MFSDMGQTTDNEKWTTVIKPRTGLFEVDLKEIWRYRDLWSLFVKRSIKVQYQNEQFQTRLKTYTGWTAQIIQHEIDHCSGVLI